MEIAEIASIFFLSAVKFMFAPGVAAAAGYSLFETILITSTGGMFGITVFYYFGLWITQTIDKWRYRKNGKKTKKVFTRKNKFIVKLKGRFGLIGLVIVTPAILSIPIGCVVAAKFYYRNKQTYPLLLLSTCMWSTGLSLFSHTFKSYLIS